MISLVNSIKLMWKKLYQMWTHASRNREEYVFQLTLFSKLKMTNQIKILGIKELQTNEPHEYRCKNS